MDVDLGFPSSVRPQLALWLAGWMVFSYHVGDNCNFFNTRYLPFLCRDFVGRDSAVCIATCYGLDGPVCRIQLRMRFSAPVQTGPGDHPASCTMSTGSFAGLTFRNRASYIYRTGTPLTSRCCILYIYSTNIRTEFFKHAGHSTFFPLQNAVYFIMLPFLVPV